MNDLELKNLERQLQLLNLKVDHLDHKVDMVFPDYDANHGVKIYTQLSEILSQLRTVTKDFNNGQLRSIYPKLDNIVRTVDHINNRLSNG